MGLGLEEADAGVQLGGYGLVLVVLGEDADECGVVRTDLGYVGKLAGAEGGVAFAGCLGVGGLRGSCEEQDGEGKCFEL